MTTKFIGSRNPPNRPAQAAKIHHRSGQTAHPPPLLSFQNPIYLLLLTQPVIFRFGCLNREVIMFRLWGKIFKDNHLLADTVICDDSEDTRTHKVFRALHEICMQFDLGEPLWLEINIQDFKRHSKTRFSQDSFIEHIDFDFLEIHVIEED